MKLASWLSACLGFGWEKSDLDWLQELWEKHHDENGNLKSKGDLLKKKIGLIDK
jgi:hypothetical protein